MASTFPCAGCGAQVEYAPGTTTLRCPYCGVMQDLPDTGRAVTEHSYAAWTAEPVKDKALTAAHVFECQNCKARTESDDVSRRCPFCGSPLVRDVAGEALIAPEAIVAFNVDKTAAQQSVAQWIRSRRFAPGALRKVATTEALAGTYLPFWTFDAPTETDYDGQRGEHYWETQTYTVVVDGRSQTRTRQVQRTRWYPASGTVSREFDDVLVIGTDQVERKRLAKLEPWALTQVTPYQPGYLAGHQTLRYDVEPDTALTEARAIMERVVADDCREDIGGDVQQVHRMDVRYGEIMFKLLLMPVWIAAYLYSGQTYQVMVNANTGEVVGERPYSVWKITVAVLLGLIVLAAVVVGIYFGTRDPAPR